MTTYPLKGGKNNGMVVSNQEGNEMGGLADVTAVKPSSFNGVLGNPKGIDLVAMAKDLAKKNYINKVEKAKKMKKVPVK